VEGEALWRPWRRWVSAIASCCALVVALVLMSLADVGSPVSQPVHVNEIASGPTPDHQGAGNGLVPPPPPVTAPVEMPPRNAVSVDTPASSSRAQLIALGGRNGHTSGIDGQPTDSGNGPTTTTTVPGKKHPVTLPGGGGTDGLGGKGGKPPKRTTTTTSTTTTVPHTPDRDHKHKHKDEDKDKHKHDKDADDKPAPKPEPSAPQSTGSSSSSSSSSTTSTTTESAWLLLLAIRRRRGVSRGRA
jgi:hypothetical protein